jgi:hypothetical protein
MEANVAKTPQMVRTLRAKWDSYGVQRLDAFIRDATARGVTVVAKWPVAYDVNPIEGAPIVLEIEKFYADRGVKVLGNPDEFRYPLDYYFDSSNHLTLEKSFIQTEQLATLLENSGLLGNPEARLLPTEAAP